MSIENKHIIYFVGIGGIGMSALARWFKSQGKTIAGYDRVRTPLCEQLEKEEIIISYEDDSGMIPPVFKENKEQTTIIYTPAIPETNHILSYFRKEGYEIKKRSQILGEITANHFTIAVAGTHGKTTTSAFIAHILKKADLNMVSFIGGITVNYNSNLVVNQKQDDALKIVVEADEFDRSFLTLNPDIAILTALDPDHLDIYGDEKKMIESYDQFLNQVKEGGTLIIKKGLSDRMKPGREASMNLIEYNFDHNPVRADNIRLEKEETRFDYLSPEINIENIPVSFSGFHNVENAIAAITACIQLNIAPELIKSALANFRGIKRRFEYIIYTDQIVFIDDYAHHPEEIRVFLESVKQIFGNRSITAVFQPHLYSRTRDFAGEFARSLELADEIILLEIYPAREKPIEGVSADLIYDKIRDKKKFKCSMEELIQVIKEKDLDILVTIGAGDIDSMVIPIKRMLEEKYEISA